MYGKQTLIKSLLVRLLAMQCSAYGDARTDRLKELRKRPKNQPDRTTISKNEIAYSPGVSTQPESHTPLLKGLVLVGNAADLNISGYENVQGVNAQYIASIGSYQNLENEIVSYYLNKPLTNDNVSQIKNHISSYYQKNHRTKVTVSAPEQNLDSGVLQLVIVKEQMIQTRAEAPLRQQQPMRRSTPRMKQKPLQFDLFPAKHQHAETQKFQGLLLLENMSDINPYGYENLRGVNVINSTYQSGYRQLSKEVSPKYVDQPLDQERGRFLL